MWLMSFLVRVLPLVVITSIWILQTNWFWSWLVSGVCPQVRIQKGHRGVVPLRFHIETLEHPSFRAHDVCMNIDWAHLFTNGCLRASNVSIGAIELHDHAGSDDHTPPVDDDLNLLRLLYSTLTRIRCCDIAWEDGVHRNRIVMDADGKVDITYRGKVYEAQVQHESDYINISAWPAGVHIQCVLLPDQAQFSLGNSPLSVCLRHHTWEMACGEMHACGTWRRDGHIEGSLTHPLVGSVHGVYDKGRYRTDALALCGGQVQLTEQGITMRNLSWGRCVCNGSVEWSDAQHVTGKVNIATPHGLCTLSAHTAIGDAIHFEGTFPYQGNVSGCVRPKWSDWRASTVDAHMTSQLSLEEALPKLGVCSAFLQDHVIRGHVKVMFSITGSVDEPYLGGACELDRGLYHNIKHGVWLSSISARIKEHGGRWVVEQLQACDSASVDHKKRGRKRGWVRGTGHIVWPLKDFLKPLYDVHLDLNMLDIAHGDLFQGVASGQLSVCGADAAISGRVYLMESSVQLDTFEQDEVTHIQYADDCRAKRGSLLCEKPVKTPPQDNEAQYIPLDITLLIKKPLTIEGCGCSSSWDGTMHLTGFLTQPYLLGKVTCSKGHIMALGVPMGIQGSQVEYHDHDRNTPFLKIKGVHYIDQLKKQSIFLHIDGQVHMPNIYFSSNMGWGERDIVSHLLFGQIAENISIWQSIHLATTLTDVHKPGGKAPWFMGLIKDLGVDSIEVQNFENDQGEVSQGARIRKDIGKVRVYVDTGARDVPAKVSFETNVLSHILLNADVGDTGSLGVGMDFVYRY